MSYIEWTDTSMTKRRLLDFETSSQLYPRFGNIRTFSLDFYLYSTFPIANSLVYGTPGLTAEGLITSNPLSCVFRGFLLHSHPHGELLL
jgi:hypothetical protein